MLVHRRSDGKKSILDGCLIEETLWLLRHFLSQLVAAFKNFQFILKLIIQKIQSDIHSFGQYLISFTLLRRAFLIIRQFYRWLLIKTADETCIYDDQQAQSNMAFRYGLTFLEPPIQLDIRERDYGEAFLSSWCRFKWRLYCYLLREEILQRPLSVFQTAREKYLDARVKDAIKRQGVKQIIILNAGYDTRAFRFENIRREAQFSMCLGRREKEGELIDNKQATWIPGMESISSSIVVKQLMLQNKTIQLYDRNNTEPPQEMHQHTSSRNDNNTLRNTVPGISHTIPSQSGDVAAINSGEHTSSLQQRYAGARTIDAKQRPSTAVAKKQHDLPTDGTLSTNNVIRLAYSYVRVIEVDLPSIQRKKARMLMNYFSRSEVMKISDGVVFAGCNLNEIGGLQSALTGLHCDPSLNTLVLAHGTFTFLSPEMIEHTLRTLRELWILGIERLINQHSGFRPATAPDITVSLDSYKMTAVNSTKKVQTSSNISPKVRSELKQTPMPVAFTQSTPFLLDRDNSGGSAPVNTDTNLPSKNNDSNDGYEHQQCDRNLPPSALIETTTGQLQLCGDTSAHWNYPSVYPKWYLSFDIISDKYVKAKGSIKERTIANLLDANIKSGFPTERPTIDIFMNIFGIKVNRIWDCDSLMRMFCPNVNIWEPWGCSRMIDAEFSI